MRLREPGARGQFIYLFQVAGGFVSSKKEEARLKLPRSPQSRSWLWFWNRRKSVES